MKLILLSLLFLVPSVMGIAFAHTVDSVDEYRLEIGWMTEPAVSGETNGIELYISPLDPTIPADEQEFKNGIDGLEKDLKIQLVYQGEKITLPLKNDHNIPGKYFSLVDPTVAGFYQVNLLGNIGDTALSLSMHPPKVENRTHIEFPRAANEAILQDHESFEDQITEIQESIDRIENSNQTYDMAYLGIGLGISGIIIASIAISRKK